jgi:hypothetical protein
MYTVQCTVKLYLRKKRIENRELTITNRPVGHIVHIYQYAKAFETGPDSRRLSLKILSKVKNLLLFLALFFPL